ncbi:endopeptidase M23B, partial [Lacticaseibacillus rhamnosus MTCC 5462]
MLKYLFRGIPIDDYYCYGQPIYAPANGLVVRAEDHYPERKRTSFLGDLLRARNAARHFDPKRTTFRQLPETLLSYKYTIMFTPPCVIFKQTLFRL